MTELKTLKDIENMYIEVNATRQVSEVMKHIKAEAVKWIKFLESEDNYDKHGYQDGICLEHKVVDECYENQLFLSWAECSDIPAVIKFIKTFFNLTEEDLK